MNTEQLPSISQQQRRSYARYCARIPNGIQLVTGFDLTTQRAMRLIYEKSRKEIEIAVRKRIVYDVGMRRAHA